VLAEGEVDMDAIARQLLIGEHFCKAYLGL
jgi:hypothetical protein